MWPTDLTASSSGEAGLLGSQCAANFGKPCAFWSLTTIFTLGEILGLYIPEPYSGGTALDCFFSDE